jgi:hypothetical protein
VDVLRITQAQRTHTLRALQDYTRLKARATDRDIAWTLVLDSLIFQAEAEIRWLDHCESRLARAEAASHKPATSQPNPYAFTQHSRGAGS